VYEKEGRSVRRMGTAIAWAEVLPEMGLTARAVVYEVGAASCPVTRTACGGEAFVASSPDDRNRQAVRLSGVRS
jgi:hypothetical protein